MVRQTVQHLGISRPNEALSQYYARNIEAKHLQEVARAAPRPVEEIQRKRGQSQSRNHRSLDDLTAALKAEAGVLAEALLGKPTRKTAHEMRWGKKGSLRLDLTRDKGAWFDHESGEGGGPLQLIVRARGGAMRDAIEWGYRWAGMDANAPEPVAPVVRPSNEKKGEEAYRQERMELAQRMWRESVPLEGTLGERYLVEARGVPRQLFGWPPAFRYHPPSNALIVGLTDAAGQVRAVQRVMLDKEGKKAAVDVQKPTTGRMEGLAVRLPGNPRISLDHRRPPLVIAEGPETGMSVWASTGYETLIAVGGSWRMSDLPADRPVIIARDDDPVGSPAWLAIMRAAQEWKAQGADVRFAWPWQHSRGDKSDFNDLLRQSGPGAVRARFNPEHVAAMTAADMPQDGGILKSDTHPKLLRLLGINPKYRLTETEIANLMNARTAHGSAIEGKTYSYYREKETGETHGVPLGFCDLTWSGHKSVSLAWAFAVSDKQRQVIERAFNESVDASMVYAEKELATVRRGAGGRKIEPGHITYLRFDHYTARPTVDVIEKAQDGTKHTESVKVELPGDPDLHTHCIVPNVVLADSGEVGSLDGGELFGSVKQLGAYFQAQLATRLRRYGGIDVDVDTERWGARITAIPSIAETAFSKRSEKSEAVAKEIATKNGANWDDLSPDERAALVKKCAATTRQKKKADAKIDFESWHKQADAIHWRPASVLRPGEEVGVPQVAERIERAYAASLPWLDDAFKRRAVLTEDEVRTIATRGLIVTGITDWKDIDRVTKMYRERGVLHHGEPTNLVWAPDPNNRWTMAITTEMHEAEETELIGLARAAHADTGGPNRVRARDLKAQAAFTRLDFTTPAGREQYAAAEKIAAGGRFALVIGVPGSGKSSALKPLVNAWHAEGKNVIGLALSYRQSEQLGSAGIGYRKAIDYFLVHPHEANLAKSSVVVIDEIGQVSTHQLLKVLRLQKQIGFGVVALGDPRQCTSLSAGPVIDLLRRALGDENVPTLLKIIRQQSEREREIAKLFRDGEAAPAIAMKREDNTASLVLGSYHDAVKHVAELWSERLTVNKDRKDYSLTVMTPTNAEAHDISAAIREKRRAWGEIGEDLRIIKDATDQHGQRRYDLPIAVGDKVRLFDRTHASFSDGDYGLIGHNGSVLTVIGAYEDGVIMKNAKGQEGRVKWMSLAKNGSVRLAYGDVLTIDAGQGMTGTEHIDAMPGGSATITSYKATVTESRHRERSFMVVSDVAERRQIIARRPIGDDHPITEDTVWANVARNLSRTPAQEAATAMIARLQNVKRSNAELVQATQTLRQLGPESWPKRKMRQALVRAVGLVAKVSPGRSLRVQ